MGKKALPKKLKPKKVRAWMKLATFLIKLIGQMFGES